MLLQIRCTVHEGNDRHGLALGGVQNPVVKEEQLSEIRTFELWH